MIFRGQYRHQSTRRGVSSLLEGEPLPLPPGALRATVVDRALRSRRSWQGRFRVRLVAFRVRRRSGGFATDDALYYADRFEPLPGTPRLEANILDLNKLARHAERRAPLLAALLAPETHDRLRAALGDATRTAWEEYLCHEAGHGHGLDVTEKLANGFFRPGGRFAPELVFAEEHRADLLSLGFAKHVLPPSGERRLFAFHFLHRFGLLAEQLATGASPGLQPYLLLSALLRLRAAAVVRGRLHLLHEEREFPALIRRLAAIGAELDAPRDRLEAQLLFARYVRSACTDRALARSYAALAATTRTRLAAAPRSRGATRPGARIRRSAR